MNPDQTASMSDDSSSRYEHRRGEIETYFDRTAADAWATSRATFAACGHALHVRWRECDRPVRST